MKRDITTLGERNRSLEVILKAIRTSCDSEMVEIVQQIRADEKLDVEALADSLKKTDMLSEQPERSERSERSGVESAERELSNLLGRPALDSDGVVKHYGHTSHLGLVKDGGHSPTHVQTAEWTDVTRNGALVHHLFDLYFCWSHPYYQLFSQHAFLRDMANGRTQYCSSLLVNAVLAIGCLYSDRPEARPIHHDPSTAGDHFFAEAKRLLIKSDSSNLTTVQALALMGLREASCGRDSSGFQFAGRSVRMSIELGLHLSFASAGDKLHPSEVEARKTTFWGCFVYDT